MFRKPEQMKYDTIRLENNNTREIKVLEPTGYVISYSKLSLSPTQRSISNTDRFTKSKLNKGLAIVPPKPLWNPQRESFFFYPSCQSRALHQ